MIVFSPRGLLRRQGFYVLLALPFVVTFLVYHMTHPVSRRHKRSSAKAKLELSTRHHTGVANSTTRDQQSKDLECATWTPEAEFIIAGFNSSGSRDCKRAGCGLNSNRKPIHMSRNSATCRPIEKCVTVTVKTRHRYQLMVKLIKSAWKYYSDLRFIVADEYNPDYFINAPDEWLDMVNGSGRITHLQSKAAVGYGRRIATLLAETKYVLVVDDDYEFDKSTNLTKMVDLLDKSDVAIVGGAIANTPKLEGVLRLSRGSNFANVTEAHLVFYPGVFYQTVPCFQHCYLADVVRNFFLAKRNDILKGGSWDPSRVFFDHVDFFLQMRKKGLGVAYCKDVAVQHNVQERGLKKLMLTKFRESKHRLQIKWGFQDYYKCAKDVYLRNDFCEAKKRSGLI